VIAAAVGWLVSALAVSAIAIVVFLFVAGEFATG
jgi:hypothetical protein